MEAVFFKPRINQQGEFSKGRYPKGTEYVAYAVMPWYIGVAFKKNDDVGVAFKKDDMCVFLACLLLCLLLRITSASTY